MLGVVSCSVEESVAPSLPLTEGAAARGQQLVEGIAACGFCHSMQRTPGAPLAGGLPLHDKYGEVLSPNITVSENGIGAWTATDLKRFMRTSMRPDGSKAESGFHRGFEWLSDGDVTRITAYLRALPPHDNLVERREIGFFDRNTIGFFDSNPAVRGYIPEISQSFKKEYGQYFVDHVARCGVCHSRKGSVVASESYLAGGEEVRIGEESKVAPNITSSDISGIGAWTEEDLRSFLRSGRTSSGTQVDPRFCPVGFYANAPARDIEPIVAYLRTVPPIE